MALFAGYLRQSRTVSVGSDGASQALQAWDLLHGNLLLHGWWVTDVSFYTTELPQYALLELAHGLTPDVMHVGGAMTYTLLVLAAAFLARGRARGPACLSPGAAGGRDHARAAARPGDADPRCCPRTTPAPPFRCCWSGCSIDRSRRPLVRPGRWSGWPSHGSRSRTL